MILTGKEIVGLARIAGLPVEETMLDEVQLETEIVIEKFSDLSIHQKRLLKRLCAEPNLSAVQLAGYGNAKWLSVAKALQRRGLADSYRTGMYFATDKGEALVKAEN